MTSPIYSALPQELLLEADPRRPKRKTPFIKKTSRLSYQRQDVHLPFMPLPDMDKCMSGSLTSIVIMGGDEGTT